MRAVMCQNIGCLLYGGGGGLAHRAGQHSRLAQNEPGSGALALLLASAGPRACAHRGARATCHVPCHL